MQLLSWGANTYSQLGHGVKTEQCVVPMEVREFDSSLNLSDVSSVQGGGGHTIIVDNCGQVFGCGWNSKGQLGFPCDAETTTIKQIDSLKKYNVKVIDCGWESTYVITNYGRLLVLGSNSFGQLGLPKKEVTKTNVPIELNVPEVLHVSSGLRHAALLTQAGQVFVWGNGKKGQLGLINAWKQPLTDVEIPTEVPGLPKIKLIACGQHHTLAVSESEDLYVWGDNKHGQLGLDPVQHPLIHKPHKILKEEHAISGINTLSAGWTHNMILTDSGRLFNWGRNTYGQLGCEEYSREKSWKPQLLEELEQVRNISVGAEFNLSLLDSGEVYSWGWNEHGNCGIGTEVDVQIPTNIIMQNEALLIGTGYGHAFAIVR